ncbi:hypothetical protein OC834_007923, partial [Tilletia horrida]
ASSSRLEDQSATATVGISSTVAWRTAVPGEDGSSTVKTACHLAMFKTPSALLTIVTGTPLKASAPIRRNSSTQQQRYVVEVEEKGDSEEEENWIDMQL